MDLRADPVERHVRSVAARRPEEHEVAVLGVVAIASHVSERRLPEGRLAWQVVDADHDGADLDHRPHPTRDRVGRTPPATMRVRARHPPAVPSRPRHRSERFDPLAKTPRTWTGARTPSGLKRVRQAERRHDDPSAAAHRREDLRRERPDVATHDADPATAATALAEAHAALDRAAKTGAIHPNAAARRKSRLTLKFNAATGGAAVQTSGRVVKTTRRPRPRRRPRAASPPARRTRQRAPRRPPARPAPRCRRRLAPRPRRRGRGRDRDRRGRQAAPAKPTATAKKAAAKAAAEGRGDRRRTAKKAPAKKAAAKKAASRSPVARSTNAPDPIRGVFMSGSIGRSADVRPRRRPARRGARPSAGTIP